MHRYTLKERAEIVSLYNENNRSVVSTQRAYRKKYRRRSAPKGDTILHLASNFMEHGSVANPQHQARPRPRRSNENIEAVRQSVAENPNVSYRRRSQQLNISGTICQFLNGIGCAKFCSFSTFRLFT